jgi:hypothetical protein
VTLPRIAAIVVAAGLVLLGVRAVLPLAGDENARLDRATTSMNFPTRTTRTSNVHDQNDDDATEVRKLAERYAEAINRHDDATVAQLNCAKAAPGLLQMVAGDRPVTVGRLERAPARERYYVALAIGGEPGTDMIIVRQDGVWCVRD